MTSFDTKFDIDFLDHVAIRVADLKVSADWYEKVLGLRKYQMPEWGDYPIFMLAKRSGVALFPINTSHKEPDLNLKMAKIDHFAFNVDRDNFDKAKKRYSELNLDFNVQDHRYFHSLYTKDPDGYTVELTTLVVDEVKFYGK